MCGWTYSLQPVYSPFSNILTVRGVGVVVVVVDSGWQVGGRGRRARGRPLGAHRAARAPAHRTPRAASRLAAVRVALAARASALQ